MEQERLSTTPPQSNAPLILVADDVAANVELLLDQLHVLGYRTITARDGPSALRTCLEERPDLCILDIAMPAGDLGVDSRSTGLEVCRRIKRDPRTKSIPVIFVTAFSDATDRVKAIEAGGDDFLTKPYHRLVLGARVRSLLRLKAATDALEDSFRKLREMEKMRDDLMKMIVHDLKTPLTSVLATLEMLLDGDFGAMSEGQRKALGDAEAKSDDLLALIGDLLEVWRVEETSLTLDAQPIAPPAFLAEVMHEWKLRFQQDSASASVDVSDEAPIFHGDKNLLKRVFGNLIQNALAHTPHSVQLSLSARREGEGVLFTVADNGPGIPEEYHELIFRKFERVKNPELPRTRSSGLGLAFCKLAIDAHGGRVWGRSGGEGKGSAFHIYLPPAPAGPIRAESAG